MLLPHSLVFGKHCLYPRVLNTFSTVRRLHTHAPIYRNTKIISAVPVPVSVPRLHLIRPRTVVKTKIGQDLAINNFFLHNGTVPVIFLKCDEETPRSQVGDTVCNARRDCTIPAPRGTYTRGTRVLYLGTRTAEIASALKG